MFSRLTVLLLILALAAGPASADVVEGGGGLVFDGQVQYAFKLGAPSGWMFDNDPGHNPRGVDIMYPKGRNWKNSPLVMEGLGQAGTLASIMRGDLASFKRQHGAQSVAQPVKTMRTGDARTALVRKLTGADGAVRISAYIEMPHAWAILDQRAQHSKDVDTKAFAFVLQSFEVAPLDMLQIQSVQGSPCAAAPPSMCRPCVPGKH